ncbi:hypothetical protein [Saccharothrix sp. NRRL B-16314]|uniref:hypothetical protein n=1 Tax=Saccharothrix sp. NRRL B-16314 TaxID=1463825 RepID=UPI0005248757|nr:hypothetical protein [Saccharothrix sp. NRRL B-16314]
MRRQVRGRGGDQWPCREQRRDRDVAVPDVAALNSVTLSRAALNRAALKRAALHGRAVEPDNGQPCLPQ